MTGYGSWYRWDRETGEPVVFWARDLWSALRVTAGLGVGRLVCDVEEPADSESADVPRVTYREKRERKAERLREWAARRETVGAEAFERASELGRMIPLGQPILVGHYSESRHRAHLARIDRAMSQAVENSSKAADMVSRAENIGAQLAESIYDDDPDAIRRLEQKLVRLESQREAMKARNAEFRKTHRAELKAAGAYQRDRMLPHQGYELTNLGGTIGRTRDRLARLRRERDQGPTDRIIAARFDSECADCGAKLGKGDQIRYNRVQGARCYPDCEQS